MRFQSSFQNATPNSPSTPRPAWQSAFLSQAVIETPLSVHKGEENLNLLNESNVPNVKRPPLKRGVFRVPFLATHVPSRPCKALVRPTAPTRRRPSGRRAAHAPTEDETQKTQKTIREKTIRGI